MKIIIDIPEVYYEELRKTDVIISGQRNDKTLMSVIYYAVAKGTPLSKKHGRLIDADKAHKEMQNYLDDCAQTSKYTRLGFETAMGVVNDAPTIIEADKED